MGADATIASMSGGQMAVDFSQPIELYTLIALRHLHRCEELKRDLNLQQRRLDGLEDEIRYNSEIMSGPDQRYTRYIGFGACFVLAKIEELSYLEIHVCFLFRALNHQLAELDAEHNFLVTRRQLFLAILENLK
jgi:hypothetical protein